MKLLSKSLEMVKGVLRDGGPSFANFAITNACNAKCNFCTFSRTDKNDIIFLETPKILEAIETLYDKGIRYLVFVGGEPLLHPGLSEIISHATEKGIETMISTNAYLLKEKVISDLGASGLKTIFISIDATTIQAHEENRGLPGVCEIIKEATEKIKEQKINLIASVTINRLIKDFSKLPLFLKGLGFDKISFSNPMIRYSTSYAGDCSSDLINYSNEELVEIFTEIRKLKSRFRVLNPTASLYDMIRLFKNEQVRFNCLGGYKSFYVDWNLDVFPCQTLEEKMCHINEFDEAVLVKKDCNKCINECYREPSLMQFVAISISDAFNYVKNGQMTKAARTLFNTNNIISLKSSLEEMLAGGRV
ncbi:MAG: Fe-S oxidoreductase [Candidatus Scalindua rubra]|uniref:Fe-S oxidoreductase n=1 Tax=Candidatus Scalindua rubra TaxID=1872076 RepID=A0A1E3X7H0_9BACT|nr:MAG: Fe-S oxidoreductase [Candidatus Scalindua rubra]